MKKYLFTTLALILCTVATTSAQEKLIEAKDLPVISQEFIKRYYPDEKVSLVIMDKEGASTEYKVTLKNSTTIEFDKKGDWQEVENKRKALPAEIVPRNISTYISARFPDEKIVKIEKNKRTTDVKLSNKLELKFNSKGEMVEIDD